jgi:hypothetical protein
MTNELKNELKEKPGIRYNPLKSKGLSSEKFEENELKLYPAFKPVTYRDFLVCLGLSHAILTLVSRLLRHLRLGISLLNTKAYRGSKWPLVTLRYVLLCNQ